MQEISAIRKSRVMGIAKKYEQMESPEVYDTTLRHHASCYRGFTAVRQQHKDAYNEAKPNPTQNENELADLGTEDAPEGQLSDELENIGNQEIDSPTDVVENPNEESEEQVYLL
ncbi:hypothetical protein JTB14_025063 [Gonioctena quinquepunctata]|nr:hypothetical protein JTB14_025063 [Gonioctena quinquepunctata]